MSIPSGEGAYSPCNSKGVRFGAGCVLALGGSASSCTGSLREAIPQVGESERGGTKESSLRLFFLMFSTPTGFDTSPSS